MNVERAEEVLMHKRLLDIAGGPITAIGPAIEVRLVQVIFVTTMATKRTFFFLTFFLPSK